MFQQIRYSVRNRPQSRLTARRRGSILILSIAMFATMVVISGLCINLAYIELLRSEQRLATDAAAKAASVMLGRTQSLTIAREAARTIASRHSVGGEPLTLTDAMIQFGVSERDQSGNYVFTHNPNPADASNINSIRVDSNLSARSGGGAPIVAFSNILTPSHVSPSMNAVATRIDMDICLVVDRSGSMAWDMSNQSFSYPGALNGKSSIQNYFQLPHATESRWAALGRAVDTFTNVLNENPFEPRVSLASYSSNFTFGVWESVVASLDQTLTTDYSLIPSKLAEMATQPLIGNTNVAAGLREGIAELTDPSRTRLTASKHIVLLCDGMLTQGDDPVALAATARAANIRISTVAFSEQADIQLMQNIAAAGGGSYYSASDETQLHDVFRQIAETLPAILTN